jgi:hypothetical protein
MDELKKYIRQHADQLDLDEPRLQVWEQIKQQSASAPKTTLVVMVTRWAVAACVLLLAGIGSWWLLLEKNTTTELASQQKPIIEKAVPINQESVTKTEKTEPAVMAQVKIPAKKEPVMVEPKKRVPPTADMMALQNMENSFTQVINLQRERVSSIPMYAESPSYFNDFAIQIRQMEKDEKQIKSDIARRGMTDGLLDQLINLYQQKLTILKQLQTEMTKTNNRYKQNRVPVDSAKTYFLKI